MTTIPAPSQPAGSLEPVALGQIAYHMRRAAALAIDGQLEPSAGHSLLAWALLEDLGGAELQESLRALDLPDDLGELDVAVPSSLRRTGEELALQLCAHFTSEGRHDLAELYQQAFRGLAR
jgi:hypothetical protein